MWRFLQLNGLCVALAVILCIRDNFFWWWFSGHPLDGKYRTNATWLHPAHGQKPVLHPTGHAVRWHHLPRLTRAVIRSGGTLAVPNLAWSWRIHPGATLAVLAGAAFAAMALTGWLGWRALRQLRHFRMWVKPLHRALAPVVAVSLAERPGSWLHVEPDRSAARIELPPSFAPSPRLKEAITATVKAKLALEAPVADWGTLHGPKPIVRFTNAPPPPRKVKLADILPEIEAAKPADLVLGLGRGGRPVLVSLDDDSPHVALSQGPGSGKSTTCKTIAAQSLYRGYVVMVWDYKRMSLRWAQGLPNVIYCKTAAQIHRGALWLLAEIERRNEVADAGADIEGHVHADVGPRIIVIAEEMNATMNRLRAYWRENGDGNRSPAVEAIEDAAFMGRQVRVNIVFVGQKMSVRASASGEARETMGIRILGRYTASTWKMLVPEVPYVPSRNEPGWVQVVTGAKARETQVAELTGHQARQLALAGIVTPWPKPSRGMPDLSDLMNVTHPGIENTGPDLGSVTETFPGLPPRDGVRLSDAIDLGIVPGTLAAIRKASHRRGFIRPVGWEGLARLYDPEELRDWAASRPRAGHLSLVEED